MLSLLEYLTNNAVEIGLSELNIGNNFFDPEYLYKLCEFIICSIPTMKRLVIAFSSLGEVNKNYIGDKLCALMKHN